MTEAPGTEAERVMEALERRRAEVLQAGANSGGCFARNIKKYPYKVLADGSIVFDSYLGQAVTQMAKSFCTQYSFQRSASFALDEGTGYGAEVATVLVTYWTSKMQYFYDIWERAGGGSYHFTAEDRAGFIESETFVALLHHGSARVRSRATTLHNIEPR